MAKPPNYTAGAGQELNSENVCKKKKIKPYFLKGLMIPLTFVLLVLKEAGISSINF